MPEGAKIALRRASADERYEGEERDVVKNKKRKIAKKPRKRSVILPLVEANQAFAAGVADAMNRGYEAFASRIREAEERELAKAGIENPLLQGAIEGWLAGIGATVTALRAGLGKLLEDRGPTLTKVKRTRKRHARNQQ